METRQVVLEGASLKVLMDIATELREQRYTIRETNCQLGRIADLLATQANQGIHPGARLETARQQSLE